MSNSCSRREAIWRALGLLSAMAGEGLAAPPAQAPDFRFVVLNDLHYRDSRCADYLQRVVANIAALKPAPVFCVLNGDLVESGTLAQLGAVKELFRTLSMPVRVVLGNHDCLEDGSRQPFESLYGKSLNRQFAVGDWQFLILDSTQGPNVYRTRISTQTLSWLERNPVKKNRPVVVFTHFPLGRNWLRPLNAQAVLQRLKGTDLHLVLSGHWHGATLRRDGPADLITSRCCSWWRKNHDGSALKGYLVCDVRDAQVSHRFIPV